MNINQSEKNGALILEVTVENLDIGNSVEFREELTNKSTTELTVIVLDLSNVAYIDSSGLGVLITFLKFVKENNKDLKLANCGKKVLETLENTRLIEELSLFNSVDEAIQ